MFYELQGTDTQQIWRVSLVKYDENRYALTQGETFLSFVHKCRDSVFQTMEI